MSLLKGDSGEKPLSPALRYLVSASSSALLGALAGAALAPGAIAVGGGIGALLGVYSPTARPGFEADTECSLRRAKGDDTDMGSEIANRRRDLVQGAITGTLSGLRQGWDGGVGVWRPS